MKPESLKKLAEALGYEVLPLTNQFNNIMVILCGKCTIPFKFDPQNNPAQKDEIIDKFKINTEYDHEKERWEAWINPAAEYWYSKDRAEAVLNAAEEFVK